MFNTVHNSDYRLQWLLKKGDIIEGNGEKYIISGDPIGFGGSSVLYPASQEGSLLEYCIKECFPRRPEKYARINGIVRPEKSDDEIAQSQLDMYRDMLDNERETGQKIRNTSTRVIGIWKTLKPVSVTTGGTVYTDVGAGIFSVLERMDKKGLFFNELLAEISRNTPKERFRKTWGLPNIYTTACIMEQALLALDRVHKAGYLFGDIQGANVFFSECDIENGIVGIGHLIDFGSARELEKDGLTAPIADGTVFSTDGFRPPEICANTGSPLRLGNQADVYSAGCLMLRCVVSPRKIDMYGDSPVAGKDALDEPDGKAIGCSGRTLQTVNAILEKATHQNPDSRYADAREMLEAVLELKRSTEPPKYLLPSNLSSPDYFVPHSRDKELSVLADAVNAGETVFLHGVGGIGKTECAIALAKKLDPPRGAYLVHFQGSMKETVLRMHFSGYRFEPKQKGLSPEELEEAEYKEKVEILREHYGDTVLIIDNFDADGKTLDELRREPAFSDFLALNLKRILTTRYPVGRKDWEIRELSESSLLELMRHYCTDSSIQDGQYRAILKEIQRHTLTAMLIARTLEESWGEITPEMILDALRNNKLSQEEYPEVVSDQNRSYRQKQIYGHLKALFDLSGMSEADRTVLCCSTLLPYSGMDALLFRSCIENAEQKALQQLVKRGWLNRTENTLKIHPIIREVCRGELKPDGNVCDGFIDSLWLLFKTSDYHADKIHQMAHLFNIAAAELPDINSYYASHASYCFAKIGEWGQAKELLLNLLPRLEQQQDDLAAQVKLACCYNNLSWLYGSMGILAVIMLFGIATTSANAASYSTGSYSVTASSGVNVRRGAGTNYAKIGAAKKGTTFTVTKISGNWGYTSGIKCTNGTQSGWVSLNYCKYNSSSSRSTYNDVFASVKGSGYSLSQGRSSQASVFQKGTFVYVWAYLHDINDNLYKSYGSGTCNMTLSIYRPDGSCAYTYTYKNCDNNWIGCKLDQTGTWKIQSKISGSLSGTNTRTITVNNPVANTWTITETINASTLEGWSQEIKQKERDVTGIGHIVGNTDGTWYEGNIIIGREVLSYKKIKVYVPPYGPSTGKGGKTVYVNLPYKIRYTVHSHEYGAKFNSQYVGNFLVGAVNMRIVHTMQCSCGKAYTCTWEMPDLTIDKVTVDHTYMIKSRVVRR